jgi:hypothetical protein
MLKMKEPPNKLMKTKVLSVFRYYFMIPNELVRIFDESANTIWPELLMNDWAGYRRLSRQSYARPAPTNPH